MTKQNKNTIFNKYLNGDYSLSEYLKINEWFRSDSDFKEIGKLIEDKWGNENIFESEKLSDKVFDRVTSGIWLEEQTNKKRNYFKSWFLKVAAALLIGLFAGYYVSQLKQVESNVAYVKTRAPKGSISETILPDGTLIVLNAGSELQYSLGENNQVNEVALNGEAWFEVEHNPERIFVVKTTFYNVNVHGTQFNVKAYSEDNTIATTLVDGKVVVSSGEKTKLAAPLELQPGEQFSYQKESKKGIVRQVNTKVFTAWKDNKLIFINMDLRELFVLLERKFGVDIEVGSSEILDFHYTGTIKNETVLEVLDLIALTLPIKYEIIGQQIKITKTK